MIENRFLYFQTYSDFKNKLDAGQINENSIAFIEDLSLIWTHGNEFGNSTPINLNEEDLAIVNDKIQFADKDFDPSVFSGLGRKYLRKNIVSRQGDDSSSDDSSSDDSGQLSESNEAWVVYTAQSQDILVFYSNGKFYLPHIKEDDEGTLRDCVIRIDVDDVARAHSVYFTLSDSTIIEDLALDYSLQHLQFNTDTLEISMPDGSTVNANQVVSYGYPFDKWSNYSYFINLLDDTMVNTPNTIYVVQYDYDLDGTILAIPENCVLRFDGGSIFNGTLIGQNTLVIYGKHKDECFKNVQLLGTWVGNDGPDLPIYAGSGDSSLKLNATNNVASGANSVAEGSLTTASGSYSHAEGNGTTASGNNSHAEGVSTVAGGLQSHAEGSLTTASGSDSHAEGYQTRASGSDSHAEGNGAKAFGASSHAEGSSTVASGNVSHAEGALTQATGTRSHAEGYYAAAMADNSHAEGNNTIASGSHSHSEGVNTIASGNDSHAEGNKSSSAGEASHSEGKSSNRSEITASKSQAEVIAARSRSSFGIAYGAGSHNEGNDTVALGDYAHAEGEGTNATGQGAHSEGKSTNPIPDGTIAANLKAKWDTTKFSCAWGLNSHAEGKDCLAEGDYSHSEGTSNYAGGNSSHAEGSNTVATNAHEHAEGQYNKSNTGTRHSVGIGTSSSDRKNAFEIMSDGAAYLYDVGDYNGTNPTTSLSLQQIIANIRQKTTEDNMVYRYVAHGTSESPFTSFISDVAASPTSLNNTQFLPFFLSVLDGNRPRLILYENDGGGSDTDYNAFCQSELIYKSIWGSGKVVFQDACGDEASYNGGQYKKFECIIYLNTERTEITNITITPLS